MHERKSQWPSSSMYMSRNYNCNQNLSGSITNSSSWPTWLHDYKLMLQSIYMMYSTDNY